jgi:hypothetical protein
MTAIPATDRAAGTAWRTDHPESPILPHGEGDPRQLSFRPDP